MVVPELPLPLVELALALLSGMHSVLPGEPERLPSGDMVLSPLVLPPTLPLLPVLPLPPVD